MIISPIRRSIQRDIEGASTLVQSPAELKAAVIKMYHTYATGDENKAEVLNATAANAELNSAEDRINNHGDKEPVLDTDTR